jgi:hypothetical protein
MNNPLMRLPFLLKRIRDTTVPRDSVRLRIEQLVAAFSLRVPRIVNLDPIRRSLLSRSIGGRLPLRHNALQIEFADLLEELPASNTMPLTTVGFKAWPMIA